MSEDFIPTDLTAKLLIAMPGMTDPRFEKSVVFMCAHSGEGSMGLIVNKPAPDLSFPQLLEQLDIPKGDACREIRVHVGGPVEHGRGFVLHSSDFGLEGSTLEVDAQYGMTATIDILREMSNGGGPKRALLALGYSGWGPGQLESEILSNGWLTCDAADHIIFDESGSSQWEAALASLGIDPITLSSTAGHA